MSETPDPKTFFRERFPAQLDRSLAKQEQAAQMAQRARQIALAVLSQD